MTPDPAFDPTCRLCPRLVAHLEATRRRHPHYHCAPVAPFGDARARLLVVGLAPGMHGANATGRPFTGDHAGILLYQTLHRFGLASRPHSSAPGDGLELRDCRLTNAVKCLPPANKPQGGEVRNCNRFLGAELADDRVRVVLALGRVAHEAVLRACGLAVTRLKFAHGAEHPLAGGRRLFDSYHCSRYNTQTRRLTKEMFEAVFAAALSALHRPG